MKRKWMVAWLLTAFGAGAALVCASGPNPLVGDFESWKNHPVEPFSQGAKNFEQARDLLLSHFYDDKVTSDQLYEYAVRGMLEGLNRDGHEWNRLYSPSDYQELETDLAGKISGVGVEIKSEENGVLNVIGIIPGSPAEKAGIQTGDQILKIGGKSFKGKQFRDAVYAIRGQTGEKVSLTWLHDGDVITKSLRRVSVAWSAVDHVRLPGNIALLTIKHFVENTPGELRDALLDARSANALVLDLRGNAGGLFDKAVESISMLVPVGTPVGTAIRRGGEKEAIVTRQAPILTGKPIAILIDADTACGAEMMTSALKLGAGAILVGEKTFGKWNSQRIDEFPNHFAIKYTIAEFQGPKGEQYDGVGLTPDLAVNLATGESIEIVQRLKNTTDRVAHDQPLRAAMALLNLKQGKPM